MFSVAIVCKSSFEVLFEHNFNSFIKTKRKKNSFDNFYLMQIVSPLILSKKILKIQAHRDISGLTFKKISFEFRDYLSFTFIAVSKLNSKQVLHLYLTMLISFVQNLFGSDINRIKVLCLIWLYNDFNHNGKHIYIS